MTRTLVADVTMSACGHAVSGCPNPITADPTRASGGPVPRGPVVPPQQVVPRPGAAGTPWPSSPRPPVLVHPLYSYLPQRHTARLSGSSFDPGRDVLCILISPLPWHQWL
jgi:hypothetical protein